MKRHFISFWIVLIVVLPIFATNTEPIKLTWPDDFIDNPGQYNGKIVELNQKMFVVDLWGWETYGSLSVAPKRLMSPTEIALPGSNEYHSVLEENTRSILKLKNGNNELCPWAGKNGYLRNGDYTNHIIGKFTIESYGNTITTIEDPIFVNIGRPTAPDNLGMYDIKVCGFNLEYYLANNYGTGFGPNNEQEAAMQHEKLLKALVAIDADIYGLVEVQQGQNAIKKLTDALNQAIPNARFAYVNDGTSEYRTYTKSCYIYRSDKITPIKRFLSNDAEVPHRKRAQCFEINNTKEKFVYLINHFKSKSGSGEGDNIDQGDGQGTFNGSRKREASSIVTFAKSCSEYYGDNDILIMGDLNAYSKEDPLRIINRAGYQNMIKKFEGPNGYTYSFRGAIGCLDHALANESMEQQITGCDVFHINTDESLIFGYDGTHAENNMYRSSDHDPVIVGLNLGHYTSLDETNKNDKYIIYGEDGIIGIANAEETNMSIWTITGQCVYSTYINSLDYTINTRSIGLNNGVYLIKLLKNNENNSCVQKLIIK